MPGKEEIKEHSQHIQPIAAMGDLDFSNGQKVYVPAYSQIHSVYSSNEERRINFAVTLSIRNTDIDNPIFIKSVSYYGDDGTLLKEYVKHRSSYQRWLQPLSILIRYTWWNWR